MPARDYYHDAVRNALVKDGWTITHDPYTISFGSRDVFIDLGADRPLAAERGDERIAVETKSFRGPSDIQDFKVTLGQYNFYHSLLMRVDPGRKLYIAVSDVAYNKTLLEPIVRPALEDFKVALIVFQPDEERIIRWIP